MTTADRVRAIIAEHLNVEIERVTDDANFIDDLNADSLDHVELTMAFENQFEVNISDDQADAIKTVGDAVKLLERKAGIGAS